MSEAHVGDALHVKVPVVRIEVQHSTAIFSTRLFSSFRLMDSCLRFNSFGSTRSALIRISVCAGIVVCFCSTTSTGISLGFVCTVSHSTYSAIGTPDCLQILEMVTPSLPLFASYMSRIWHIFFSLAIFSKFLCSRQS